jgi:hypothetical protein
MEQPSEVRQVRSLVVEQAEDCLARLQTTGETLRPEAVIRTGGGWTVCLLAYPTSTGDEPPGLTPCDRDCLALLAQVQEPLSGVRARRELEKRGIGIYGVATVKRSLAKLKRMGLVTNSRTAPPRLLPAGSPATLRQFHER